MSNTVAVRYRSYLPGSGFDSNGSPKQGKEESFGVITVTSAVQGESLPPSKLGLTTIDYIDLKVQAPVGGGTGSQPREAHYDYTSQEFYLLTDNDAVELKGDNVTLRFHAFGDSIRGTEFL